MFHPLMLPLESAVVYEYTCMYKENTPIRMKMKIENFNYKMKINGDLSCYVSHSFSFLIYILFFSITI